jgi:hypothetical protein
MHSPTAKIRTNQANRRKQKRRRNAEIMAAHEFSYMAFHARKTENLAASKSCRRTKCLAEIADSFSENEYYRPLPSE